MPLNIPDILKGHEGKTLEFKRDASSLKPIMKTIIAFANTAGGALIIGREDSGKIIGIQNSLLVEEQLASAIADTISPILMPEIELYTYNKKELLIIQVPHLHGAYYLKSEGPEKGVYVRLGSTNRQAGPEIIAELRRLPSGISFDQIFCSDADINDLDREKLKRVFLMMGRKFDTHKLESLGIAGLHAGKLAPTNGGVILFGKDEIRERYFPDARVSCARFKGKDRTEFIDRLDIEGGILNAIDEVPKFIRRNTKMAARIKTMKRQDIPEYPEVAVREVLINAIVHADYSLTGMRILVAVYDDRMEIQNPGMLPFGMTLDELKAGVSKIRNRVIARIFREMKLIEEWGSGYKRVIEACRTGNYPFVVATG